LQLAVGRSAVGPVREDRIREHFPVYRVQTLLDPTP
jgi:hypothetical protein